MISVFFQKCTHLRVKQSFRATQPSRLVKHKPVTQTNTALYLQYSSNSRDTSILVDLQNMSLQLVIKMTKGSNNHTIINPLSIQNLHWKETSWLTGKTVWCFSVKKGPENIFFLISFWPWAKGILHDDKLICQRWNSSANVKADFCIWGFCVPRFLELGGLRWKMAMHQSGFSNIWMKMWRSKAFFTADTLTCKGLITSCVIIVCKPFLFSGAVYTK